jgi:hypothetical protein
MTTADWRMPTTSSPTPYASLVRQWSLVRDSTGADATAWRFAARPSWLGAWLGAGRPDSGLEA